MREAREKSIYKYSMNNVINIIEPFSYCYLIIFITIRGSSVSAHQNLAHEKSWNLEWMIMENNKIKKWKLESTLKTR